MVLTNKKTCIDAYEKKCYDVPELLFSICRKASRKKRVWLCILSAKLLKISLGGQNVLKRAKQLKKTLGEIDAILSTGKISFLVVSLQSPNHLHSVSSYPLLLLLSFQDICHKKKNKMQVSLPCIEIYTIPTNPSHNSAKLFPCLSAL